MTAGGVCILGSVNLDITMRVQALPRPGETVACLRTEEHPGGKGANQAVAAARMGARARLVAALGGDKPGEALRAFLVRAGVDTRHLVELDACATGRAFVCVEPGGENIIVVDGGANLALRPGHLPSADLVAGAVRLAQLETPIDTVAAFFQGGPGKGLRLLNAAPAVPQARTLFDRVDMLILNETELQSFAELEATPAGQEPIIDAARTLMTRSDQAVIVTRGSAGALVVTQTDALPIKGRRVSAVDTTGAGDCFCGVLAAALAGGAVLADAAATANAAAALAVGKAGAAASMPERAEVDAFIAATGAN